MARSAADPYKQAKATPNICPDFLNGHCKRGKECPYRHDAVSSAKDFIAPQGQKVADIQTVFSFIIYIFINFYAFIAERFTD